MGPRWGKIGLSQSFFCSVNQIVILVGPQRGKQIARVIPRLDGEKTPHHSRLMLKDNKIVQRHSEGFQSVFGSAVGVCPHFRFATHAHAQFVHFLRRVLIALNELFALVRGEGLEVDVVQGFSLGWLFLCTNRQAESGGRVNSFFEFSF